ncbi:YfgM family protein [Roseateles sp. BYS180W]|uniref:Ancillary SecYEG translocon subunit n=1 Tax=Roseateles rivi TaxID=3299028 RepID=A0ABW7FVT7_9BURK
MASHLDLEEQEQLEQLKAFWNRWGNLITGVVTLVVAVFAAWTGWNWWQREQGVKASAMYAELERVARAGDLEKTQQVFADIKDRFAKTTYAGQAALVAAKLQADKGKADEARATLTWATAQAQPNPLRDVARLRLAGLHMDAKQYDEAAKALDAIESADFAALQADRRGDLALLKAQPDQAREQFKKAYTTLKAEDQYRRLVEVKLASLGVDAETLKSTEGAAK